MPEHTLFHFVFLCQVLLVSFYFPRKLLNRMRYVFEAYPPSTHPKLYPQPIEYYEKARRNFSIMNWCILAAGLLILGVLVGYSRSGEWDHVIAMWYVAVQFIPVMLLDRSLHNEFKLMRLLNSRTTRTAELRPRRLLDYLSPAAIGLTAGTYLAFVLLVIYVRQFDFQWFGGYLNVAIVTIADLLLVGIIFRMIYGKKPNPHQSSADRARHIETTARIFMFVSIAATTFISLSIVLSAFDLRSFHPAAQSVYFQLLALISLQGYQVNKTNFDVYKEDPLAT